MEEGLVFPFLKQMGLGGVPVLSMEWTVGLNVLLARVAEGALALGDRDLLHRSLRTEPLDVATGSNSVEGRRQRWLPRTRESGLPSRDPVYSLFMCCAFTI